MRYLLIIVVPLLCVMSASAQNKTTLLQRINEIKQQTDIFFWDQYTHPNADTAKVNATKRLLLGVNLNRDNSSQLSVDDVMPHASYINIDRGNLKQFFVYIKKTDANAITRSKQSLSDGSVTEYSNTSDVYGILPTNQRSFVPDGFVLRIMEAKTFVNVYKLLKSLKAQGQVLQYGKLRDVEDYSSLDLILFDIQSQQIITMLSSVTANGNRINEVDGSEDSLDNYPTKMTAVIWYIRK